MKMAHKILVDSVFQQILKGGGTEGLIFSVL